VAQRSEGEGLAEVNLSLSLSGQTLNTLVISLRGQPLEGGGLQMTSSEVTLGPRSQPGQYRGVVTALEGSNLTAQVRDSSGHRLTVVAQLQINGDSGSASGTVRVSP
jgi:hypothetical protein